MAAQNSMTSFNVKISQSEIDGDTVSSVSGKELHERLKVARDFTSWVKYRINKFGFVEGVDYLLTKFGEQVPHQGGTRSVETTDYIMTIDMAKQLSMVENNEQGRAARRYFIACEKAAKSRHDTLPNAPEVHALSVKLAIAKLFEIPLHIAQIEVVRQINNELNVDLSRMLTLAPAQDNIRPEDEMLEPMAIGERLGHTDRGQTVNKRLAQAGMQNKAGKVWEPTPEGLRICSKHSCQSGAWSGYNYKWNFKAVKALFTTAEV